MGEIPDARPDSRNMPGLVRKLFIFATLEGLILQPHVNWNSSAIRLDYRSNRVTQCSSVSPEDVRKGVYLESYGIIGELQHLFVS